MMGLFNKNDDYNLKLKNAVEEYINASDLSKGMKVNKIKKYASKKLKKEKYFNSEQMQMLKDVTSFRRGGAILKYNESELRNMCLSNEEYKEIINERELSIKEDILNGKEITIVFLKQEESTTNNAGLGALGGGLLFGVTGAVVGSALGANNQTTTSKMVMGESGRLKIAQKGIVISNKTETVKIPWSDIKKMGGNFIDLGEGKNILFYKIDYRNIVSEIINENASYVEEDGW
ncbi:MAG: hypothetical protein LBM02_08225 [Lachnospiraceae bacterium]|jgi:hypothetical protein|nr:hypothetical protein [Lachnospiraceae bacterium]